MVDARGRGAGPGRPGTRPQRWATLGGALALLGCLGAAMWSPASRPESQWLGMELEPLTPSLRAGLGLPAEQQGVYVSDVVGVAMQSGVREGDVIVAVNSQPVQDLASLRAARGAIASGVPLLGINRQGAIITLPVGAAPAPVAGPSVAPGPVLTQPPSLVLAATPRGPAGRAAFGAEVNEVTPDRAGGLGLAPPYRGVVVTDINASGGAALAGVRPGDLILHVNGYDVVDGLQFWSLLAAQPIGSSLALDVFRSGQLIQLAVPPTDQGPLQPAAWTGPGPCPLR